MKVICIDAANHIPSAIIIPEGEVVNVSQCPIYSNGYDVLKYPNDKNGRAISYRKTRFIPCSDIDETELLHQRQTQYA